MQSVEAGMVAHLGLERVLDQLGHVGNNPGTHPLDHRLLLPEAGNHERDDNGKRRALDRLHKDNASELLDSLLSLLTVLERRDERVDKRLEVTVGDALHRDSERLLGLLAHVGLGVVETVAERRHNLRKAGRQQRAVLRQHAQDVDVQKSHGATLGLPLGLDLHLGEEHRQSEPEERERGRHVRV
jgi:hypothetical protein